MSAGEWRGRANGDLSRDGGDRANGPRTIAPGKQTLTEVTRIHAGTPMSPQQQANADRDRITGGLSEVAAAAARLDSAIQRRDFAQACLNREFVVGWQAGLRVNLAEGERHASQHPEHAPSIEKHRIAAQPLLARCAELIGLVPEVTTNDRCAMGLGLPLSTEGEALRTGWQGESGASADAVLDVGAPSDDAASSSDRMENEPGASTAPEMVASLPRRAAQGLPSADRGSLERSFGQGLGHVRLHGGDDATAMTGHVGASAFAIGNDVVIPDAVTGEHRDMVLAHEVAHTIQQQGGTGGSSDPELAADAAASAYMSGEPAPLQPAASRAVAGFYQARPPPALPQAPPQTVNPTGTGVSGVPAPTGPPGPVGNQGGHQGRTDHQDRIAAKDRETFIERKRLEYEVPRLSIEPGGSAANAFVTPGDERVAHEVHPATQQVVTIPYRQHRFHAPKAIDHDVHLSNEPEEVTTLWYLYLKGTGLEPPWAERDDDPDAWKQGVQEEPREPEQRPKQRTGRLPDGAVASILVPGGLIHMTGADPDGAVRAVILTAALGARGKKVPALAKLVVPDRAKRGTGARTKTDEEEEQTGKGKRAPVLYLPAAKAPHLARYEAAASRNELVHDVNYDRADAEPAQRRAWMAALAPGGDWGMSYEDFQLAIHLVDGLANRVLAPDWTRKQASAMMEVDHIIELQVTPSWLWDANDTITNFELLERAANRSSGSIMKNLIDRERSSLAKDNKDQTWLTRKLVFKKVVLTGDGLTGERWRPEEIRDAEHIDALMNHVGKKGKRSRK